jgi:hypothetical protein
MGFAARYTALLFLCIIGHSMLSQTVSDAKSKRLSFPEIIERLEQKYDTKIFYRQEWISDSTFPKNVVSASLQEAIQALLAGTSLSAIYLDDLVVFVPSEPQTGDLTQKKDKSITIGDPAEAGRTSDAVLRGRIADGGTQEPLTGAVVYDERTKSGASADADGSYSIQLPVGKHKLRVSFVGYEDFYQQVNLVSDGKLNFELFEKSIYLDEFTVTAQRAEVNLTRTQMSFITLDSRTIKQLPGAFGERDIIKSFSLLPGVQSIGEFGTGFHIRGGSADQNLILIEDVPLFNTSHLFGLISIVNPDMVSSVTMMKAGVPARYGERASSVIDIRLSGEIPDKTQLMGGIGLLNSRLLFNTPLFNKKASFALGGRSSYSSWLLQRMPDVDLMNSDAGFYDLSAVFSAEINPKNNFTIFGYQSGDNFSYAGKTDYAYSSMLASFRWNTIVNDRFKFRLSGGASEYDYQVSESDEFSPGKAYKLNSGVSYQNMKLHFDYYPQSGRSVDFGVQAFRYEVEPGKLQPHDEESLVKPFSVNNERALEMAAYVNTQLDFGEVWGMELGLRYVHYLQLGPASIFNYNDAFPRTPEFITDTTYYEDNSIVSSYSGFEPRLSLRYMVDETSSLKISYNRNHQFINLISNTSLMTPSDVWKLSDQHLKPLVSNQFAIGYFRNFFNNRLETSVELYYKHLKNLIDYKNGADILLNPHIETDLINAKGYNYGLEFYVNRRAGRLNGWISYTYAVSMRRSDEAFKQDQINENNYFPSNYDRPHNLVINANYDISRRWRLNAVFTYNTGRPVTLPEMHYGFGDHQVVYYSDRNKYRLPDYHRLDISLSFGENLRINRRGKGSWSLSVINVYGRKNPYSVFYQKDVPSELNNYRHYSMYQLYIIGRPLPTITYNFSF